MTANESTNPLLNIDRRIVWVIITILMAVPLVNPLMLPIGIDEYTKNYYAAIEDLPPGSAVLVIVDYEAGLWGEFGAMGIATIQHLLDKDIQFIVVTFYRADAATIFATKTVPAVDQTGNEYGVDWVNVGYIEGKETAMATFAQDFAYSVRDYYGNELQDMEVIQDVPSLNEIDLVIGMMGGTIDQFLRQIVTPFGVQAILGTSGMTVPDCVTYYEAGLLDGMLGGLPGAAQYEYVRKKPGLALVGMDALSATQLFLLALALVTNAVVLLEREA